MAWWIFQNVVITTALAAAVAIACRAGRLGPVARHALWVLVLVKFVTPPLVAWPWAAPDPLGIAALDVRIPDPGTSSLVAGIDLAATRGEIGAPSRPDDRAPATPTREPSALRLGATAWLWLLALWIAGSLCVLGVEVVRILRLARRVRIASNADPAIVSRVAALSARLGLRAVPVVNVPGAASPAIWCVGRPRLLWPAELTADSTDACIDGLLVHELAHVKRRDHLVGWIELAAGVVWWWNPLFWWVRAARREQAELACDAWVISALPNGRRAYAESLLTFSGAAIGRPSSPPMAALIGVHAGSRRVLERRLVMIMKGRAPLRLPFGGLLTVVALAVATLPAWATGSAQQAPPPPPPSPPVVKQTTPPPPPPPAPPAAVRTREVRQNPPPPPPPQYKLEERPKAVKEILRPKAAHTNIANLPEDVRQLVQGFETERTAIQKEAEQRITDRRQAAVKALEALQEQYAKAGKLDEAVAIRDYLRAGGPPASGFFSISYIKKDP